MTRPSTSWRRSAGERQSNCRGNYGECSRTQRSHRATTRCGRRVPPTPPSASAALSDEVAHSGDVDGVARVCETAEVPGIFDGAQHRVVVERNHRCPRLVGTGRDRERQDVAAAWVGIAAATCVAEACRPRPGEVTLVPGDEDDGIRPPCLRRHDLADRVRKVRVAGLDQVLLVREVARVGGPPSATAVHVVALVRADPAVVRHSVVREIGRELEKSTIFATRAGLDCTSR